MAEYQPDTSVKHHAMLAAHTIVRTLIKGELGGDVAGLQPLNNGKKMNKVKQLKALDLTCMDKY